MMTVAAVAGGIIPIAVILVGALLLLIWRRRIDSVLVFVGQLMVFVGSLLAGIDTLCAFAGEPHNVGLLVAANTLARIGGLAMGAGLIILAVNMRRRA